MWESRSTYLPYLVRAEKGRVNDTVRPVAPPWHVHVGSAVPSLVYTTAAAVFTWMHANARCSHGTCRVRPMRRPCTTSTSPPFEPEEETALLEPSSHPSSTPSIPKVFAASPFPLPPSIFSIFSFPLLRLLRLRLARYCNLDFLEIGSHQIKSDQISLESPGQRQHRQNNTTVSGGRRELGVSRRCADSHSHTQILQFRRGLPTLIINH